MPEQSPECLAEITLRTERVYDGRAVSLRVDAVRLPDGSEAKREVVEHPGAVALVALSDHGEVLLVRQWRHAAGQALLEIPAGTLEPGEAPIDCAGRELIEETGFRAGQIEPLTTFFTTPGFTQEKMHVFVARDLEPAQAEADADEFIAVVPLPWDDALRACRDGRIADGKTIAGILLADRLLNGLG